MKERGQKGMHITCRGACEKKYIRIATCGVVR